MPEPDDCTLLRRYAAQRDEAAFAEVVRRHFPLVYSAALRRLGGDTAGAQDVAQAVFGALARDAGRIARSPVLSGWLYTATGNAVINLVRDERRRRTREVEAAHLEQTDADPNASADWSRLRPVLDSALDGLNARDREAVLLRYFESRPYAEIGAMLALNEDAARKRIERALAKLGDLLRSKGVVSTTAALAMALSSQPACAVPEAVLTSITAAATAVGSGSAASAVTFVTMTKLQVGIAAAVIVAGACGLLVQRRTISKLRAQADDAEQRVGQLTRETTPASGPGRATGTKQAPVGSAAATNGKTAAGPDRADEELRAETAAALRNGKVAGSYFAFTDVLRKLSRENWRQVLRAFEDERKRTGLGYPEVFKIFARRAGEVVGKDAVTQFIALGADADANEAMIGWATENPVDALQWLGREVDAERRHQFLGAVIRGLAFTDPEQAIRILEDQPAKERIQYTDELVTSMLRPVGVDGAQHLVEAMIARAAATGALQEDYLKAVFSDLCFKRIAQAAQSGNLADVATWLSQYAGQPYLDHRVIAEMTAGLAQQNPKETFRWLEGVNAKLLATGDTSTAGYRVLLDTWRTKEGAPAVEVWLQQQTGHPHYDHIAWQYAALLAENDAAKATVWADTIKDPAIKQQALEAIRQRAARAKS